MVASLTPTIRYGSYAVRTRLWRADRNAQRIEEIGVEADAAFHHPISGTIEFNQDTETKRSLSLEIVNPERLRSFGDYLIPEVSITDPEGHTITRPLGHYLVTPPSRDVRPGITRGTIQALSTLALLARDTVDGYTVDAGTDYGAAARQVALDAGWPPHLLLIPDIGLIAPEALPWDVGTSRLTIINDLLNAGLHYTLWPRNDGVITTAPWQDVTTAAAVRTYATEINPQEIVGAIAEDPDWGRVRNRVTVRRVAPGQMPLWATAEITNPEHPLHPKQLDPSSERGMILGETIDDAQLPDQATAQRRAELRLAEGSSYYRKARLTTLVDLNADAHDVLALDIRRGSTVLYDGRWWRRTWRIQLRGVTATMESEMYRTQEWR